MLIGFGLIVLDNYHDPSHDRHDLFPADQGFVEVIAEQVIDWSQDLYRTTEIEFDRAFAQSRAILDSGADTAEFALDNDPDDAEDAASRLRASVAEFDRQGAGEDGYGSFSEFVLSVIVSTMHRVIGLVLWVIRWVLVGQYMWGWFMLSLLSLVGPLFVPAIVISQVDWLFWNWLRGLFAACIYMLSAATPYAVSMILLLTPLTRINNAFSSLDDPSGGFGSAMLWLGVGFLEYIPIFFLVSYMSLQAGTISSGPDVRDWSLEPLDGRAPSSAASATRPARRPSLLPALPSAARRQVSPAWGPIGGFAASAQVLTDLVIRKRATGRGGAGAVSSPWRSLSSAGVSMR